MKVADSRSTSGRLICLLFVVAMIITASLSTNEVQVFSLGQSNQTILTEHWIGSKRCYRGELNQSDSDYNNCWTDDTGKILVASALTYDSTDAVRSLGFIESNLQAASEGNNQYYLPEVTVLNSSVTPPVRNGQSVSISNGIVGLSAANATASHFDQLALGTSYTGFTELAYIGGDRIWFDNGTFAGPISSQYSSVFQIPNGFSKRSFFSAGSDSYYVYLNATIQSSDPFLNVSVQFESLNSSPSSYVSYLYVQAFNTTNTNPFYSGALYSSNGSFSRTLPYRGSSQINPLTGGIMLSYSNSTNVFTKVQGQDVYWQDAVAIKFGSASFYDWEHWANDVPFEHAWFGPAYYAQNVSGDSLSNPIYSSVYPILHFDYHLANQTAKFIASEPEGVAVSPPVGFGFVSYGLALEAVSNVTLRALAEGFWNYYYAAYENSEYGTPYARSLNLLTLAGFKLYGCNSTVETFARNYLGNTSGVSIEEYGWGAAALYALKQCTGNQNDADLYDSFVNSFGTSESRFILLSTNSGKTDLQPEYTFQFGETASGLMLGGLPYSSPIVIGAMNAVLQSNQSGTLLNQPFFGDFANTETLPAYMLSMSLFQGEMRNQTGLWITSLTNGNITSIDYANGTLLIGIEGYNSSVSINGPTGIKTFSGIYENRVLDVETAPTSISILTTTATTTSSSCTGCLMPPLSYLLETALLTISACLVLALFLFRKRLSR